MIVGDLNSKTKQFGPQNEYGKHLETEILPNTKAVILNEKNEPTFFWTLNNKTSSSTIDLFLGSPAFAQSKLEVKTRLISPVIGFQKIRYHVPVVGTFRLGAKAEKSRISFHKSFIYAKADWEEFRNSLDRELIDDTDLTNINSLSENLEKAFNTAANTAIPKTKEKINRDNFPEHIVEVLKSRNFWSRKYRKNQNDTNGKKYKDLELLANDLIKIHRREQWKAFLDRQGRNPLSTIPFWRRINRLRQNKRSSNVASLKMGEITILSDAEKANLFANRLENTFKNTGDPAFDNHLKNKISEYIKCKKIDSKYTQEEKIAPEISMNELIRAQKNLNNKTSRDPGGLSNKMLKAASNICRSKMLELFNLCLKNYLLPLSWKKSTITMILKSNSDASNIASYRPISMTSCLARLFERIILRRLKNFLDTNKILIKQQSGFRSWRQTKDNLVVLTQKILEAFNKKEKAVGIFFDIASAFDKVWHEGLIFKMVKLKIPYYLVRLIQEFLTDRSFIVKIGQEMSKECKIECGVPQGAVLSPTLFSIFVNDVPIKKSTNSKTLLFADDIASLTSFTDKILAQTEIQSYLDSLEDWMNKWRLKLAPHKCAQITFSRSRSANNEDFNIRLYGELIPKDNNPKFLGIVFDRRLRFEKHIANIKKKSAERLNIIKILAFNEEWKLNDQILLRIYKSLTRSIMEYSSFIYPCLKQTEKKALEVIQNNALRVVFRVSQADKISIEALLACAGIQTMEDRLKTLLEKYFLRAEATQNPLIDELYKEYDEFRKRDIIDTGLAENQDTMDDILLLNTITRGTKEKIPTILCSLDEFSLSYNSSNEVQIIDRE